MKNKNNIVLSFGSNLGNREDNISAAYNMLDAKLGKRLKTSDMIHTEAWGFVSENLFCNSAAEYETDLTSEQCLVVINETEKLLGRIRSQNAGYEDRIIDIDILFYNDDVINTAKLTVPHPLLHLREFVLVPLRQILPDKIHPVLKKKIKEL